MGVYGELTWRNSNCGDGNAVGSDAAFATFGQKLRVKVAHEDDVGSDKTTNEMGTLGTTIKPFKWYQISSRTFM